MAEAEAKVRPMSAAKCRKHLRDKVREEFPKIADGFVEMAKTGSVQHVKHSMEILGPVRRATRRKKNVLDTLLEEFDAQEAGKNEQEQGGSL